MASKTRASTACRSCMQLKKRCSDERPCTRCIRNGKSNSCMGGTAIAAVQRPMAYNTGYLELKNTHVTPKTFSLKNEWAYDSVMRICAIGYQPERIARCFDSIPPQITFVVRRVLKAMEELARIRTSGTAGSSSERSSPANFLPESPPNQSLGSQMLADAARWETQSVYGFFQVPASSPLLLREGIAHFANLGPLLGCRSPSTRTGVSGPASSSTQGPSP